MAPAAWKVPAPFAEMGAGEEDRNGWRRGEAEPVGEAGGAV